MEQPLGAPGGHILLPWYRRFSGSRVMLQVIVLTLAACLVPELAHPQVTPSLPGNRTTHELLSNNPTPDTGSFPLLSHKQKQNIVKANFEKSKSDAAELSLLAKELCEELNGPNVSVLSVEVVNRVERIEKLAKKIRDETKGF